ncbi:MAG: hypothetical protein RMK19_07240 [Bacteroidia bacterium]|nr:hypothetical protein [Bacteroidia bacterium]
MGLRRLRQLTPSAVYRFRRRIKRLRVYLSLYTFPAEPPTHPSLDTLFRRAGKLRQAYLNLEWIQAHAPHWRKAAKKEVKRRRRRLKRVYKAERQTIRDLLRTWKERFPFPWRSEEGLLFWAQQVSRWVQAQKQNALSFPAPPFDPTQLHELRTILRRWELAGTWAPLPETPPANLTSLLGKVRDLYLLHKWLTRTGAEEELLQRVEQLQKDTEAQALALWNDWRFG